MRVRTHTKCFLFCVAFPRLFHDNDHRPADSQYPQVVRFAIKKTLRVVL